MLVDQGAGGRGPCITLLSGYALWHIWLKHNCYPFRAKHVLQSQEVNTASRQVCLKKATYLVKLWNWFSSHFIFWLYIPYHKDPSPKLMIALMLYDVCDWITLICVMAIRKMHTTYLESSFLRDTLDAIKKKKKSTQWVSGLKVQNKLLPSS